MIESELKRIADALEKLIKIISAEGIELSPIGATPPLVNNFLCSVQEEQKETVPPPPSIIPPPPEKESENVWIPIEELNDEIMIIYNKLGCDDTKIINIFKKYGAVRISELDPKDYQKVLTEVKELV